MNNALANALYGNVNRISELPGMRRFNMADRNRDKLRSSANWQANDALSLQGGLDLNDDRYSNSVYGLQSAKSWASTSKARTARPRTSTSPLLHLRGSAFAQSAGDSYTANSAASSVAGFTTISGGCFATIALRNASNKIDPCLNWNTDMRDKVDTLGLAFTRKKLMSGKLDARGGLTWSQARSDNGVTGGNYANNPLAVAGAPAGTVAAFFIPATALPTVKTDTIELKLNLRYAVSKQTGDPLRLHLPAHEDRRTGLSTGCSSVASPASCRRTSSRSATTCTRSAWPTSTRSAERGLKPAERLP